MKTKILIILSLLIGSCETEKDKLIKEQEKCIETLRVYQDSLQMQFDSLYKHTRRAQQIAELSIIELRKCKESNINK